jgi:hypothetical protein
MKISKDEILKDIQEFFKADEQSTKDLLNQVTLFVYSIEKSSSDLYHLAKLLPDKYLTKVINYFDGGVIRVPSKEEYKKNLLLTIMFFLSEIKGYDWAKIKEILDLDDDPSISTISIGKKLQKIKSQIRGRLQEILISLNLNEVLEIVKKEQFENSYSDKEIENE